VLWINEFVSASVQAFQERIVNLTLVDFDPVFLQTRFNGSEELDHDYCRVLVLCFTGARAAGLQLEASCSAVVAAGLELDLWLEVLVVCADYTSQSFG